MLKQLASFSLTREKSVKMRMKTRDIYVRVHVNNLTQYGYKAWDNLYSKTSAVF